MKRILVALSIWASCASSWALPSVGDGTIAPVNPSDPFNCGVGLAVLTGMRPVMLNGRPVLIRDRSVHFIENEHDLAAQYLAETAKAIGIGRVEMQSWSQSYYLGNDHPAIQRENASKPIIAPPPPPPKKTSFWTSLIEETPGFRLPSFGTTKQVRMRQVIITVPGSDPKLAKETILVGAHYDVQNSDSRAWLGKRPKVGEYFASPGADDNGTGVMGVMQIMQNWRSTGYRPKRTVQFVLFDGEEPGINRGVDGSSEFVHSMSASDRRSMKMAFILDMLGQPPRGRDVRAGHYPAYNVSVSGSNPMDTLNILNANRAPNDIAGLVQGPGGKFFIPLSDNRPFMQAGIPATLITDVATLKDLPPEYHSTNDLPLRVQPAYWKHVVGQVDNLVRKAAE